jgi:hypothetical protein
MKRDHIDIRKPNDYLRPQRQFEETPRTTDDYRPTRFVRAVVSRPQENLRLVGKFVGISRTRYDFKTSCGDRADIKKSTDNLEPLCWLCLFCVNIYAEKAQQTKPYQQGRTSTDLYIQLISNVLNNSYIHIY